MTQRTHSRSHLLLVNPLQSQWLGPQGQPLPAPPGPTASVRVVADLVEETHIRIDVPGLMGKDRQSFIGVQYQAQLPDVPLRASWERPSAQPLLPKPFSLHALGASSPALVEQLQTLAQAGQAIEGVWALSYLMAHWAARHAHVPQQGWLLLCLGLPYGMRMVLLHNRVPVFSRLLLEADAGPQGREIALTLKYLADNRIVDRDAKVAVLPMNPEPALQQNLQRLGLHLLPPVPVRSAHGVLAEVLSLAGPRAPGQLANETLRRHHLAARARRGLHWATGAVLLAGLAGLAVQGRDVLGSADQSRQWRVQAAQMEQESAQLRADLERRHANVPMLRLAMQVQAAELQGGVDPTAALWQLGSLMQVQTQAQLVRSELALRPQPCAAPSANPAEAAPAPADAQTTGLQPEWVFEIRPSAELAPRQRQALLETLVQSIGAWPAWQVRTDPVRAESTAALAGGQGAATDTAASAWRWCLAPRAQQEAQ